jgi:AcrR family transcriptional regulator
MQSKIEAIDQNRPSFIETARRAQIIECAIDAIAELGFAQASLAQIARRAGVSTGVISYYFPGKDALIREVVAHVFTTGEAFIRPRVDVGEDPRATLLAFIKASVAFIGAHPNHPLAVMGIIRAGRTESGALRYDPEVEESRRTGFRSILEWGQREGVFRTFDVEVIGGTIIEALDLIPQRLAADPKLDIGAYAHELVELFDRATRSDRA